jgi:hypothetical protein
VGRRQKPFGFGWLADGEMPFNELLARVNRIAYREFTHDPDESDEIFRRILGQRLFRESSTPEAIEDVLTLQQLLMAERTWSQAAPLADPERVKARSDADQFTKQERERLREELERIREIERRWNGAPEPLAEIHRAAAWVMLQWSGDNETLLAE